MMFFFSIKFITECLGLQRCTTIILGQKGGVQKSAPHMYEKVGSVYVVPYAKFFVYCLSKKSTSLLMFYIKIKIANLHV